ncbi:hypothetical protein [Sphingomonas endophytica]|uniref:Outer membrane protein beta-barrel domain-containing protein n=1 Tax=Sphingomonas endophytica TaxID=869719 RepID=A0A147I4G0_9SPHN|nr:hypothetical protein [Sphingomonas endophytica]KTT73145.1 hypothetical protein NS334_07730 [Sphingomonas endophytica]
MKTMMTAVLAGTALMAAAPAAAEENADGGSHIRAAVTAGTLGIGPELAVRFNDHLGVRGGAGFLGVSGTFESEDEEYDGKLRLKSYGAVVDVYPFGGAFRLSGGARINRNRVDVGLTPSGDVTIGDVDYTASEVGRISGRATANKFAPVLTFGWAGQNRQGFFIGTEFGVMFQGAYRLDTFRSTGTLKDDQNFKDALERERQSLQNDVDKVKVWPIAQLAIGWRF